MAKHETPPQGSDKDGKTGLDSFPIRRAEQPESAPPRQAVYTSSTSMPSVVAEMLTALRAEPGMRMLEIGTATGWNTALLAPRLGSPQSRSPRLQVLPRSDIDP
jgi:hypothetical protein